MLTVSKNNHFHFDISPPTHEPVHMKLRTHYYVSTQFDNSLQIITVTAGHLSRVQEAAAAHLHPLLLRIVGAEWKWSADELTQGLDAMSFVLQAGSFILVTHLY